MGPAISITHSAPVFVPVRQATSLMFNETTTNAPGATEGPIDLNTGSTKTDGSVSSPNIGTNTESVKVQGMHCSRILNNDILLENQVNRAMQSISISNLY